MNEKTWAGIFGAFAISMGIFKTFFPSFILEFRERHPWVNLIGFFTFIFKTKYAKRAVIANGIGIILLGSILLIWSITS
ncbi:hypothetical protein [Burkholderia sp. Ac-20353]|uniref:hypothetical protein n=1 Tax=Burkholderia sp. Ac-20353 TaxID=2703894 RepID=UPI00197C21E2|nr:hypothetical protein [Burkholderia sp. Ac-20353]MBN3788946.1 hypothetical protein [Burkholderia sp. Ac-20353]